MLAIWAIVGHSERRRDQGETDAQIGRKLLRCAEFGLRPILCVGEQLDEREAGKAEADGPRASSTATIWPMITRSVGASACRPRHRL